MTTQTHTPGPAETAIIEKIDQIEAEIKTLEAKIARSTDNWDLHDRLEFKIEEATYYLPMLKDARKQDEEAAQAQEGEVSTTPESIAHDTDVKGLVQSARDDMDGMDAEEVAEWIEGAVDDVSRALEKYRAGQINWTAFAVARNALKADIIAAQEKGADTASAESVLAEAPADF